MKLKIIKSLFRASILVLFSMLTLTSCIHTSDPSVITLEEYRFSKEGDLQRAVAGNYLTHPVAVVHDFYRNGIEDEMNPVKVYFEVVSGGGTVDDSYLVLYPSEKVETHWQLGSEQTLQSMKARVYDGDDNFLNELTFQALAFQSGRWDPVSIEPDASVLDLASDTIRKATFMVANGKLFRQGDVYFGWQEIVDANLWGVYSVEIDSQGILYVGVWSGDVFKSQDGGTSFSQVTKPIPGYQGHFELYITADDKVWVSRWGYPLRHSADGGQSWIEAQSGIENNPQVNEVFSLSNGHFLTLSDADRTLYRSTDDGVNWEAINTPEGAAKIYVTPEDDIIVLTQRNGLSLYQSSDEGQTYEGKYAMEVDYYSSPMGTVFHKYGSDYYICMTGGGIVKTSNFETFNLFWDNTDVRELWMDHNGVMLATQLNLGTVFYYR